MGGFLMKATSFTVETSLKFFGLDRGTSSGTMLQATYTLEDGDDLGVCMLRAKEKLDALALKMEVAQGGVDKQTLANMTTQSRAVYDRLLGRNKDVDSNGD